MFTIVLPVPGSAAGWRQDASAENQIDFRHDPAAAERCTAAYAASELSVFLSRTFPDQPVEVSDRLPEDGSYIKLEIAEDTDGGGFELCPGKNGTTVTGHGRNGLLNGIYELLRILGWRFLEPGQYGEVPPVNPTTDFLKVRQNCTPSFRYRMIDQYRESDASVDLLKWFSRNRINVVQYKPATGKFADKLGMLSRKGGHLLDTIMNPETIFDDGRAVFEAHPEWFGLPENGSRQRETAVELQPCFSNRELLTWLGRKLESLLRHEMSEVDILDLWGFDTNGKTCSCPGCRALGNGSDQFLHMLTEVQKYLREHLERPVFLNTIAYGPTATIQPPEHPVSRELADSGSFVIFYPIARCYRHLLADPECEANRPYHASLSGWKASSGGMNLWAGEYYNVSKFEDLPLVYGPLIAEESKYYQQIGCTGITYMHNLSPNWGMRTLTQLTHTQYAWDASTEYEPFLTEYLENRYAVHAGAMRKVYALTEAASRDISAWRGFGGKSILWKLSQWKWDGHRPEPKAALNTLHYPDPQSAIAAMKQAGKHYARAIQMVRRLLREEQWRAPEALPSPKDMPVVRTPRDLEKIRGFDKLEYRLGEDLRGLLYGYDSCCLLTALAEYYEALRTGSNDNPAWRAVERYAARMSEYFMPVTYEDPTPGVHILDALSRTQLRMTLTRCRAYRKSQGKKI